MRLLMGNLISLYRESRDNKMESGVGRRETMIWNPESGVGNRESKGTQRPLYLFVIANHISVVALMIVVALDNLAT